MTKEYDNTNRGVLFRNKNPKKEKSPTHTGNLNVEGVEYFLSAWVNKDKNDRPYFSISITKKNKETTHSQAKANGFQPEAPMSDDVDNDIPF